MNRSKSSESTAAVFSPDIQETACSEDSGILEEVLDNTTKKCRVNGIVVGTLTGIDDAQVPLVDFPMNPTGRPLPTRSTVALETAHIGRDVALLFEQNDVRKPIVIGLMHASVAPVEIIKDNQLVAITAEKELLLRCGESSILLREDGKIVIKGKDILSRARRTNKVKGGSVQLN